MFDDVLSIVLILWKSTSHLEAAKNIVSSKYYGC